MKKLNKNIWLHKKITRTQANRVAQHFTWGKIIGKMLKYVWWKPRARKSAKYIMPQIPNGAAVLDIGAGNGLIAEIIANEKRAQMTLIDVLDWNLSRFPLVLYHGTRIPFRDKQFDVALLIDVVHHAEDEKALMKEAIRVAKKVILVEEVHDHKGMNMLANIADNIQYVLYGMPVGVHSRNEAQWLAFVRSISPNIQCIDSYLHHSVYRIEGS